MRKPKPWKPSKFWDNMRYVDKPDVPGVYDMRKRFWTEPDMRRYDEQTRACRDEMKERGD